VVSRALSWGETGGACIGKPTGKRHGRSLACSATLWLSLVLIPNPLLHHRSLLCCSAAYPAGYSLLGSGLK